MTDVLVVGNGQCELEMTRRLCIRVRVKFC